MSTKEWLDIAPPWFWPIATVTTMFALFGFVVLLGAKVCH